MSETGESVLFDAVITPHRSLSPRASLAVALALSAASAAIGGALALLGAWPVLGFSGAEIALAAVLLVGHARAGRAREHVRLTARALTVRRTDWRGRVSLASLPSAWLALSWLERPGTVPRLVARRGGRAIEVATMLGEPEKRAFGDGLADALERLRAPRFDNPVLREDPARR